MSVFKIKFRKKEKLTIDYDFLLGLIKQVIFHDTVEKCIIKGKKSDWAWLPGDKSLFCSLQDTGLAIGNLTSQLFANIYLDDLDKFIKYTLGCKYYGRYVDDFVVVHQDKQFLLSIISQIEKYLKLPLKLTLHPRKRYLQHYCKGVQFLGAYIKPHRIYVRRRIIGGFKKKTMTLASYGNKDIQLSVINSHLGILKHRKNYKIRKSVFK